MDAIQKTLTDTGDQFVAWIDAAGPKLLSAVVILVLGWTVAKLARTAITKALTVIKLDTLADKAGINAFLKRGNIESTSVGVIGSLTYWLLLLLTLLVTVKSLGINEAELVFQQVFAIIPQVIIAVVILILGLSFARFIGDIVQTACVNTGITQAGVLSAAARYAIVVLVVMMALGRLAPGIEIVQQAFLLLFGALCLGLGLAFGLGCKDLVGKIVTECWENECGKSAALSDSSEEAPAAPAPPVVSESSSF
jgi:hypothetical protein